MKSSSLLIAISVASLFLWFAFSFATTPDLPVEMEVSDFTFVANDGAIVSAYEADTDIQNKLDKAIESNPEWAKLVRNKKMAIGLVDLSDESTSKYAYVNGQHMMYAASLPKIAVLLAAADAIDNGEMKYEGAIKSDMQSMIAFSNNAATTRMIDRLGFSKIKKVLTATENKLYDFAKGGGLWVGKRYAAAGKRMPDPIKGLSHAATVEQVCRFYHKLYNNDLISESGSKIMKECLVDPQLHHKFVNSLDKIDPNAKVYRKSGTWKNYHADSVLVVGEGNRKYILVALIEGENGSQICKDLVYTAENVLGLNIGA